MAFRTRALILDLEETVGEIRFQKQVVKAWKGGLQFIRQVGVPHFVERLGDVKEYSVRSSRLVTILLTTRRTCSIGVWSGRKPNLYSGIRWIRSTLDRSRFKRSFSKISDRMWRRLIGR